VTSTPSPHGTSAQPPLDDGHISVDGCTNFRDAGGWPTTDGRRMVTGRLYRSDGPLRVTQQGRDTIWNLGIRLVVDLRQDNQVERTPGFLPPEHTAHVALVDRVIDTAAPPPLERPSDFADLYEGMLEASRAQFARALDEIADRIDTGPVLVHCSFGKDRAGLVTALIQAAIGVTPASIIADYARSDEPARRRHEWMRDEPWPGDVDLRTVPVALFRAHPEAMEVLLGRLVERHGSLDDWVASFETRSDTLQRLRGALIDG
jgi:protein-tyrosine phosphatase